MAQQLLEQFHASHPDIRVFFVPDPPSETFDKETRADFEAGTAADVFQGCCSFFPIWAQMGYTLDLRPYVAADEAELAREDWDPVQYRSFFTRSGEQYGLPKYHGALALYYNKDLLDEYGVDYPDGTWDHDDYLDAMRHLTDDRDGDGETDLWGSQMDLNTWERIQVHVNGWGGHLVDPDDPRHSLMAEPPALEALEWLRARLWDDRVMARPVDVQYMGTADSFIAQKVAMVEDGSWALKAILAAAPFRIGVAPFPAGPVRRATLATTDGFGIYAQTHYPDQAWDLIKFLVSPDYGRAMARAHFLQPARESLVDDWIDFVRAEYPDKSRDMDLAAFADGHRQGYSVMAETFANQADAQGLVLTAWQQILTMGQQPVDLIKDVSRQVEATQQGGD